tara:strand:- start:452 stop:754 length:303 start_codon:yes stop_codon:yes gene_type:complete
VPDKTVDKDEKYWQDIFNTVNFDYLPVEYLNSLLVKFKDGRNWEIDLRSKEQERKSNDKILQDFFQQYNKEIVHIDFRVDLKKVKNDVSKRTKRFLKFNK